MLDRKTTLACLVAAISLAIVGIAANRIFWRRPPNPVAAVFADTRAVLADVPMRDLHTRADLEAALSSTKFEGVLTTEQQSRIIAELINALDFYYLHDESAPYKQWRERGGARLRNLTEMEGPGSWPLHESINFINNMHGDQGFKINLGDSVEDLFDQFWRIRRKFSDHAHMPVAIADAGAGLFVRSRPGIVDPRIDPDFAGELGQEAWFGGTVLTNRTWYDDPRIAELSQQPSLVAQCGIVLDFADGLRRPLHFIMIWDPEVRSWRIRFVLMTNSPAGYAMWPWEL